MAEDEGKKDEFDFDPSGEALGYISLEQARVVAMRTAREAPGEYGQALSGTRMAYQLVEQENGDDYYIVTLSFRPEGDFAGTEGHEQFFIEKEGTVAYRQVLSLPRRVGASRFPVVPVAIGLLVVIVAIASMVFAAGFFSGGEENPAATRILTTPSQPSSPDIESTPEDGSGNGVTADVSPATVKFPGFDFQLEEGTFWEYKWETESGSFCRDCPRGTKEEAGTFLVSLGGPKEIEGNTVYQVKLSGDYKKEDGNNLAFAPRWKYVGGAGNKIVASEDGFRFVVVFDGEKGEWQGGGFFSSRFGTDTEMSAREGQIPDPISQWPDVPKGPVLAVGQSAKDGECTYERLTGTTVCDDNRSKSSQSELFREGVGPVAYFFTSNFSSGEGLSSFSATSREYVGLVASSLLGDVSAEAQLQNMTTTPSVMMPTTATPAPSVPSQETATPKAAAPTRDISRTVPTVPERLPGSGVAVFATPVPDAVFVAPTPAPDAVFAIPTPPPTAAVFPVPTPTPAVAFVVPTPAPSSDIGGILTTPSPFTPTPLAPVDSGSWKALSPTYDYTCGLTVLGQAYCWGTGNNGVLGTGGTGDSVTPAPVSGGLTFESISSRDSQTCAVTPGGAAYCWGAGSGGSLGNGSTDNQSSPVMVAGGLAFKSVIAMGGHACGVTTLGDAYCWGNGFNGVLGSGSTDRQTTPTLVSGALFYDSISGSSQTCGVTTRNAAYCWGRGGLKLGVGSDNDQLSPAPVLGGFDFASVVTGHESTCGLTTKGEAFCWGADFHGRLGNGPAGDAATPEPVAGGLTFTSLTSGADQVCGIVSDGSAYCWGRGQEGQLGNGSLADQDQPQPVSGGLRFSSLNAGTGITCGVTTIGVAYCWGDGYRGQLGNGKAELTATPVRVVDPG
ncbi:MAG: hypothetical protein CMJ45_05690 [Planctomyces sp.]|nr:hypothetical protein [Planctomyces sp.]